MTRVLTVGVLILERVKFPPWGHVSAPAGVAPEALEECLLSFKGYKRRSAWLIWWGDRPASFSAGLGIPFSRLRLSRAGAAARSLIWSRYDGRSGARWDLMIMRGGFVRHVELHSRRWPTHSRVRSEPRCARSPRALARVKAFKGTLIFSIRPSSPFCREEG